MSAKTKEYLRSSLITFLASFLAAILPFIDSIDLENVETGLLVSIIFTGVRAGVKAIIEYFISIEKQS